jgi:GAF domain-containing protein
MNRKPLAWRDPRFQRAVMDAITDALAQYADQLAMLLRELVLRLRLRLAVDTVAILLKENGILVARAAAGLEEEVDRGLRIPVGAGFAGRVAATGQPVVLADVDHADVVNPLLREKRLKSMLGVPLVVGGAVRGVLHVGLRRPHQFESPDIQLLQLVADRVAPAIENARGHKGTDAGASPETH